MVAVSSVAMVGFVTSMAVVKAGRWVQHKWKGFRRDSIPFLPQLHSF